MIGPLASPGAAIAVVNGTSSGVLPSRSSVASTAQSPAMVKNWPLRLKMAGADRLGIDLGAAHIHADHREAQAHRADVDWLARRVGDHQIDHTLAERGLVHPQGHAQFAGLSRLRHASGR